MGQVTKFIRDMRYIRFDSDDPTLEYIMELADAVEADLEALEDRKD